MDGGTGANTGSGGFSDRVLVLFLMSVFTTGIGVLIGFMLARVLGPAGKGDFYLLTLVPVTVMVLLQLGLPQAFGFFSAKGQTLGTPAKILILTAALTVPAFIVATALIPLGVATFLHGLDRNEIILALCALPLALNATLTGSVLLGRQAVRWYAAVNVVQSLSSIVLFVFLVAVLDLGVVGALWAYLLHSTIGTIGWFVGALRSSKATPNAASVSYSGLFRYGLPLYPATFTNYFSSRVDVFLLAFLVADPSAPLGYYSMAVTMAQLVFFFPNAVSTLFFPHVAGSDRDEVDRQVPMVARVTLLLTASMGLALIPAAIILIEVLLPAFEPSLVPLFILLPGVVALSQTKVLTSYVAGLGRTGWTSAVNVAALVVNVIANLILIPQFGIAGASAASLVSYSASAIALSFLSARLARSSLADFWIPRLADVRFTVTTVVGMGRRVLRGAGQH